MTSRDERAPAEPTGAAPDADETDLDTEIITDLDVSEDETDAVVAGVCARHRAMYGPTTRNN